MRMKKDVLGWRIEPDTKSEEESLDYLFTALNECHGSKIIIGGSSEHVTLNWLNARWGNPIAPSGKIGVVGKDDSLFTPEQEKRIAQIAFKGMYEQLTRAADNTRTAEGDGKEPNGDLAK